MPICLEASSVLHCGVGIDSRSCLPSSSSKSGGMGEKTAERGPNTAVASVATAVVCGSGIHE